MLQFHIFHRSSNNFVNNTYTFYKLQAQMGEHQKPKEVNMSNMNKEDIPNQKRVHKVIQSLHSSSTVLNVRSEYIKDYVRQKCQMQQSSH